jgi:hypothetical protein
VFVSELNCKSNNLSNLMIIGISQKFEFAAGSFTSPNDLISKLESAINEKMGWKDLYACKGTYDIMTHKYKLERHLKFGLTLESSLADLLGFQITDVKTAVFESIVPVWHAHSLDSNFNPVYSKNKYSVTYDSKSQSLTIVPKSNIQALLCLDIPIQIVECPLKQVLNLTFKEEDNSWRR